MNIDMGVWASIALLHFVAVASPGPDFAVVLKQSLQKGLTPALWTSLGIGSGILLHVAYSILGISLIISTTPWLFNLLLYLAAAYFLYIGLMAIRSKPNNEGSNTSSIEAKSAWYKAFILGFLTNGLNPKATLFFLALFTAVIPAETSLVAKTFYGAYLALATFVWFSFLSVITNFAPIRSAYQRKGYWFDRIMGIVLIVMAIILVW